AGILRDAIALAYFPKTVEKAMGEGEEKVKEKTTAAAAAEARQDYNALVDKIQAAYDLTNDFAVVARKAKTEGIEGLETVEIKIGSPIKVMLAVKAETVDEALETVGRPAQCEYKYDGFRLECHRSKDKIWLYTRRLENVTHQFPDVVEYLRKYVKGDNYILDSEAVGYDPKTQKYVPFQNISQRIKRKYDIDKTAKELPVEVNVFDVLIYEDRNMLNEPFRKRRELIEKVVKNAERKIVVSKAIVADKAAEIEKFFKKARADGTEGLMLKNLEAPYQPGARVGYMLKFKKVMESLDLVVVAAEWGEGKRAKWLSSYYLACNDNGKLKEIGKVSTGLKEKREEGLSFGEVTELLKPLIVAEEGRYVKLKPKIVLEVAYEEIQKSPTYESGYALRFPRVIRNRSNEKSINDINTLEDVERLYRQQKKQKA
ncbi:MAG: ATP-dependent DNA ligase, partial [Nanoarchaeota archaeon]